MKNETVKIVKTASVEKSKKLLRNFQETLGHVVIGLLCVPFGVGMFALLVTAGMLPIPAFIYSCFLIGVFANLSSFDFKK